MSRDTASVIKPSFRTFAAPVEAAARRRTRSSFVSFWSLFKRIESLRDEAVGARFQLNGQTVAVTVPEVDRFERMRASTRAHWEKKSSQPSEASLIVDG
mgnify:CR=1 FL=1